MTGRDELRVAVVGVGVMGADHVRRIVERVRGARCTVVSDVLPDRAAAVSAFAPGSRAVADPYDAIAADDVDAVVLASPATMHEKQVLACLAARKPVLCEKPLTTEAETALDIVRREIESGVELVQVGFMRRYDTEYLALRDAIASGKLGTPLVAHCVHRNPSVPDYFDSSMVIKDCLVHEIDATRYLLGEEIRSVQVLRPTPNSQARRGLQDPQLVIMETTSGRLVDVELFVTSGIGYEVRMEVVGESGSATLGFGRKSPGFIDHFAAAYDAEVQSWVDAVHAGPATGSFVDGPGAWDGYAAAAVCAAGLLSLQTGNRVSVELEQP
ncbi:Gfo/Idh/MocA family oxidoreductase [Antrihabitans sp. YC3-6]|uniref:Inositol 2-dehydrogenase n=1 Tax=Antrihabitans stalagmiti TaxID=2799499 RepID=A0A934NN34_9NOCA|nr:Gfo/Idh/MocA family oxidoreductase [Antrihabitans stalagmiti]MBJ8338224.1 Gfo/Idh/MocA family oxidoreductase [Antrihabitans stalagmiti]